MLSMLLYSVKDDLFHDNSLRNELDLVKKNSRDPELVR